MKGGHGVKGVGDPACSRFEGLVRLVGGGEGVPQADGDIATPQVSHSVSGGIQFWREGDDSNGVPVGFVGK